MTVSTIHAERVIHRNDLTSQEVCERAGVSYRQLDVWTRGGLIPGVERLQHLGSGVPRRWSNRECQFVVRLARFVRAGLSPKTTALMIAAAFDRDGQLPDSLVIGDVEVRLLSSVEVHEAASV